MLAENFRFPLSRKNMFEFPVEQDDATEFAETASELIFGVIATVRPTQVFIVKIDQWFDHKWLGFSFKLLGAVGCWQSHLTLPPFHPHRVRWQRHFVRDELSGVFSCDGAGAPLHVIQNSEANSHRKIASRSFDSSCLIWYSGGSASSGRGSLMAYYSMPSSTNTLTQVWLTKWYASMQRDDGGRWLMGRQKEISPRELNALRDAGRVTRQV